MATNILIVSEDKDSNAVIMGLINRALVQAGMTEPVLMFGEDPAVSPVSFPDESLMSVIKQTNPAFFQQKIAISGLVFDELHPMEIEIAASSSHDDFVKWRTEQLERLEDSKQAALDVPWTLSDDERAEIERQHSPNGLDLSARLMAFEK